MINVLILTEEYEDAERYARISYECLTRSIDTESEEVANAAESLANIMYNLIRRGVEGVNVVEAEMLSRKVLRIRQRVNGANNVVTVNSRIRLS